MKDFFSHQRTKVRNQIITVEVIIKKKQKENLFGAALLEFALLLPILVFLLVGTIELSVLNYNKYILVSACREGARFGINKTNNSYPSPKEISDYTFKLLEKKLLSFSRTPLYPTISIYNTKSPPESGSLLTVSARYTYFDYLLHKFLDTPSVNVINNSVTMVYQ